MLSDLMMLERLLQVKKTQAVSLKGYCARLVLGE